MDDWKQISLVWQGEMNFKARNASGASVQMGILAGQPGVSPMELVLVGLAGCTASDVVSILQKKRQPLQALKIEVRGKRAADFPKVYTEIEVKYLLWGDGLNANDVEKAITLSEEKYCSVGAMLRAAAAVRSSYQIFAVGENQTEG